jgi:hypothetical protein
MVGRLLAFSVLVLLSLAPVGSAQSADRIQLSPPSPRPLADESERFQESRGKIVTYEEPILTWSGDLVEADVSSNRGYLSPKPHAFFRPPDATSEPNLTLALNKTLEAYHHEASGPRFQILTSKWGYHIVPLQVRDASGAWAPATSLLDSRITIAQEERTAQGHLDAFAVAVSVSAGKRLEASAVPAKAHGFDEAFRARPERFPWGAEPMVARDALIDLLSRSATSFSWRLRCQASSQADARFCVLNLGPVEVAVTNANGEPSRGVLWFDRCGDCPPLPGPPASR